MANIPVKRKDRGGVPWWVWLLGLVALVGLGALLIPGGDEELTAEEVAPADTVASEGAEAITDLGTIWNQGDRRALIGREVRLTGLVVPALTGDSTFYVSSAEDPSRRVLVVLERLGEVGTGGRGGEDGRYEVNEGDVIDLRGTVAEMTSEEAAAWGVPAEAGAGERVYVRARRLNTGG